MKRILFIAMILVCGFFSQAQNPIPSDSAFAIKQSVANAPTTLGLTNVLQAKKGFINGVFTDTTQANLYSTTTGGYRLKYYPGAQIFTTGDSSLWVRNSLATRWMGAGGSAADIVSFNFITDSSLIICYGNGVCDTIAMYNFNEQVINIVNNFTDSSITFLNDSTIIICNSAGSCDTIELGTTNNFYFTQTGDTLITCDTVQVICDVPDSCYQQQLCDTILLGQPLQITVYQNYLRKFGNIVEVGAPSFGGFGGPGDAWHDTYLNSRFPLYIYGAPLQTPAVTMKQWQWTQESSSIAAFSHYGAYQPTFNLLDENNPVSLYVNYTNPFDVPTTGAQAGDTTGFMGNRYGYLLMTNSKGNRYSYSIDDVNAKQVGIFFDTYTDNNEGVSIFANRTPSSFPYGLNPATDSTLLSARVAIFKTDRDVQFPNYPDTRNDGASPSGKGFYADADGNLLYGALGGGTSGSVVTILNDSTIEVCNAGSCDTIDIGTPITNLQNVFVVNDTTLLVCNVDNTICDTVDLSDPAFFDRGFFDPNQAAFANATHNAQTHTLTVTGTSLSSVISVTNTSAGIGLSSSSVSGYGLSASSTSGTAAIFSINPVSTNTVANSVNITRNSSGGAGGDGVGTSIEFYNESSTSTSLTNQIISKFTTANHATRISQLLVTGVSAGVTQNVFAVSGTGQGTLHQYGDGTFLDTTITYLLGAQTDGDVVEIPIASLGGGSVTIINDTTITICSFGEFLCDTFITVLANPIQYVTIINDSTLQVCDTTGDCDTLFIGSNNPGFDRGFFDPNQISNADTYHQMNGYNFSLGIGLLTPPSGYLNMNFLTGNTVSGNENVVFGRNMVVAGNTNFVAATDGTVTNAVNYSATFGDANDQRGTASLLSGFGNDNYVENALVGGNDNVNGALTPGGGTANQYTGSIMLGVQNRSTGNRNTTIGYLVQNTGTQSITMGAGFGSTRLVNSMASTIGFGQNSDSVTMYVHPAAGTTGSIGKVSIGTSAPTATRLEVVDNAVTSLSIVKVSTTSTGAASNTQRGIESSMSGANSNANQTTAAIYGANTHTGSNIINYGVYGTTTSTGGGLSAGVAGFNTSTGWGVYGQSGTSGTAIEGQGPTTGIGVQGSVTTSGTGVRGNTDSGHGIMGYAINGDAIYGQTEPASQTGATPLATLTRRSNGGVGTDGIAGYLEFQLETSTTSDVLSNRITSTFTTATHASRASTLLFSGVLGGLTVDLLTLAGDGSVKLRPITATEASAITPAEGMIVMVSNTNGTFTSIGFWGYQNGAWAKM